jgi:hypothetical protein
MGCGVNESRVVPGTQLELHNLPYCRNHQSGRSSACCCGSRPGSEWTGLEKTLAVDENLVALRVPLDPQPLALQPRMTSKP